MLTAGSKLGPYEITGAIGAGGMGEVYRARDSRLDRVVAVKVLPDHLADQADVRERFEREARTVASLNHPHICVLHDIGRDSGTDFLVMEFLDGETLAARLQKGPLPIDQVLRYAIEIADALDKAHRKGITHRDLKPGNIMLTKSGAKLLDFGLAKLRQDAAPANVAFSQLATLKDPITAQGTILGTVQYMAPEQVEGKEVDARTDIFAFGAVLYEMATGKRAFEGKSQASVMAAILEREPAPISSLQPMTPTALDRVVKTCLAKDPDDRWQTAGDLCRELKWISEGGSQTGIPAPTATRARGGTRRERLAWVIAATLCVATAALAFIHFTAKPPAPPTAMRFQIRLPENTGFTRGATLVLSPDGLHLAFSAIGPDGPPHVWVQDLDGSEARVLSNTDVSATAPPSFWSPDSRFVVFSGAAVRKVDILNGTVQDICPKPGPMIGGSWNRDGTIIFGSNVTGLWRVPAEGGTATPLTALDASRHEREHELPQFLPDGKHFLYFRASDVSGQSGMYVGSLDDPPDRQSMKQILATDFGASYVAADGAKTGYLLFLRGDALMAQRFDSEKLELSGEASEVAERIGSAYETAQFAASSNIVAYRTMGPAPEYQLTWMDDQGKKMGETGEPGGEFSNPNLSPDGTHVVFSRASGGAGDNDLWVLDLARGTNMRFTFGAGSNVYPVWSPDGREIVFSSSRDGGVFNLYRKPADGSHAEQLLLKTDKAKRATGWSRDGRLLLFESPQDASTNHRWALPMQGDAKPISFPDSRFDESFAEFSPDGRWIAYMSNETGRYEIYVQEFSASTGSASAGGKWLVSKDGGSFPRWRADGKQIVYVAPDRFTLMSVSVDTSHSFQAGTPHVMFQMPLDRNMSSVFGLTMTNSADMKRFLLPLLVEQKGPQSFTVMLNWTSALKTK